MEKTFNDLPQRLLQICDNSTDRLTRMILTPFLNNQTPIYWAICHLPSSLLSESTLRTLPKVVIALIVSCGSLGLNDACLTEMHKACCIRNTNALFQRIDLITKAATETSVFYTIKLVTNAEEPEFEFFIVDFPTRMLVQGKVDMRFIANCERIISRVPTDKLVLADLLTLL